MSKGAAEKSVTTTTTTLLSEKQLAHDLPFEKKKNLPTRFTDYLVGQQIQIGLPSRIIVAIILGYLVNPTPHNILSRFLFLSYPQTSQSGKGTETTYGKGLWDICIIFFWVLIFTFMRESMMQYILQPFARWAGINSKRKLTRFSEQGYAFIYYTISSASGLYIMYQSPYWYFNTTHFWTDYPHFNLTSFEKYYYLIQFAFWIQQIAVLSLNLEKPRKDFLELVAHHIITLMLISLSYTLNFTRIGNAVFITMDFSDIWLAFAKCLKYLQFPPYVTDTVFAFFVVTWVYTRHYLFGLIIYSVVVETCTEINPCFFDVWNGYWVNRYTKVVAMSLLCALQILMIYWFGLIMRIAWKVICGNNAEDMRSDSEDDNPDSSNNLSKKLN